MACLGVLLLWTVLLVLTALASYDPPPCHRIQMQSVSSRMVISYGKTIVEVLTVDVANYIQRLYRHYFRPNGDHFTGFVEIIRALRRVLNGYNLYDPNHAHFEQLVGGGSHVTSGVLATITLAFLSMFWSSE